MKIVYCIAATYNSGGMERVLVNKANYLVCRGYDVCVITTDQGGRPSFFELNDCIRQYDLRVNYERNNGKSFLNKLFYYPLKRYKHKHRLKSLLMQLRADIVISMFCNDVFLLPGIHDGSCKVLEIHFSKFKRIQYGRRGLWRLADWYRSRMDECVVSKFHRFIVLTHEDAEYWGNLPNMLVIPNALSFYPGQIATLNNKRVIAIGRYDYQKGFDRLIQVWNLVHRLQPDWVLDIIGSGELAGKLQSQIDMNGLQNSIALRSPTNHIEEEYLASSLFVMTSRYEGLPMVLLEAQACGLPIVSFACKCGPKDLITDGENGFLVADGDVELMAIRLVELMKNETLRRKMGDNARVNAGLFLEKKVMDKWEDLFHELIN
ncbi:MAG: glycosyltransferase family 4 protein [Bacteroides sp.]|jgi:glycosyltransferase involved in cell wall biosynthesis|nr:glycosyltransferase family 4 protein [Bacteroides sp.]MCI1684044.1 glycosyltransferase family 4 protein [Bacteroides sp.]